MPAFARCVPRTPKAASHRSRGRRSARSRLLAVLVLAAVGGGVSCGGGGGDSAGAGSPGPGGSPSTVDATGAGEADPASAAGQVRLEPFGGTFAEPVGLVAVPGDDDVVVTEKAGRLVLVREGRQVPGPLLDVTGSVSLGGEQGLLSVAFAPDYAASGLAYIFRTDLAGTIQVEEYRRDAADPDRLDPATRRAVLTVRHPYPNHNGGQLLFDRSGMLLIGLGDGGDENDPAGRGQDLSTLLGKILRIDPRPSGGMPYGIPPHNPFLDRPGVRPEIWASGLRNPWRFSLDPDTGTLVLGDVGQYDVEELDVVPAETARNGANYGWSVYEGDQELRTDRRLVGPGPLVRPALTYRHADGACSITAGGVYRGPVAALRGSYLYGDFCTGMVFAAPPRPVTASPGTPAAVAVAADTALAELSMPVRLRVTAGALASFGTDGRGEMYVVDIGGRISRLTG